MENKIAEYGKAVIRMNGEWNILSAHKVADYNAHAPAIADAIEKMLGRPARFPRSV